MEPNESVVLIARDLVKEYGGNGAAVRALDGVSLDVKRGGFISVMGPSGSGKSTLLHVMGALDRPTSGDVSIENEDLARLSDKALSLVRRHKIGFIFQFFSLVPVLSAEENIALPAVIDGDGKSEYSKRVDELLELVGLDDRRANLPSELSGGQQQRVAIARALLMRPSILLADEPTGNLDSKTGLEILQLIKRLQSEEGQTVVMVTHDPRAAAFGESIVYLKDGRIGARLELSEAGGDDPAQAVLSWLQTVEG